MGEALSQPADPWLELDQRKPPCDVKVHFQAHKEKMDANSYLLPTVFQKTRKQRASVAS